MQEFRFVILGAGSIAHKFADAVRRTPSASVAAVASKSAEKAAAFAEKEQIGKSYADYEEMLVREKPDAAYIATTVNFHRELALLCIRHHVPVLCEKAMFSDSAQAQEVFAEAKKDMQRTNTIFFIIDSRRMVHGMDRKRSNTIVSQNGYVIIIGHRNSADIAILVV
ncbi:MAG: Gfo/Idh/MocA family oxidoreductase, partial [Oscillospiraceae bacterium]|nr:Gfo/Idh/MocA family oxidoreductase [Oscillospiraceae bacterium]